MRVSSLGDKSVGQVGLRGLERGLVIVLKGTRGVQVGGYHGESVGGCGVRSNLYWCGISVDGDKFSWRMPILATTSTVG